MESLQSLEKAGEGRGPPDSSVWSLIVDFEDAFMSTDTRDDEQRFTVDEVDDSSSATGSYVYV